MIKGILKWIGNVVAFILIALIILSVFSMIQAKRNPGALPSIAGYRFMTVLTGSMRPLLEPGDMVISRQPKIENIKVGDVITFLIKDNVLVTHRVTEIVNEEGKVKFRTKGDANNAPDSDLTLSNNVVGTLLFNIPKGGYATSFLRSTPGIIFLVVILVAFFVISELSSAFLKSNKKEDEKEKALKEM